ncbi:hypothetical protein POI8812_02078 [Pontivivens insulae]|uniref:DUF2332 domain-containing protein n=2 Tax=Pontivivens insulae TaxID=1639689 RepID=A0A2R8AC20_9RHOB|nr:hypothetical protein DFR53_3093 [Pontivivens insulae]SPF29761.1 hypothetical protein POI8812_02078 [Pontivivens insulae]
MSDAPVAKTVLSFSADPRDAALALRLCGGLHALSWRDDRLAEVYPPNGVPPHILRQRVSAALFDEALQDWLKAAPQTNEVARSGVLLGGLLTIAARNGALNLYEIGSSAGLNLFPEKYRYDFGGGRHWGAPDATVTLECEWSGAPPAFDIPLEIMDRAGSDLSPIDASNPQAAARMLAYIWPDQPQRLARARAALALVGAARPPIATAGAAEWLASIAPEIQNASAHPVIFHSVMWGYLSDVERRAVATQLAELGRTRPLSWLRLELDDRSDSATVQLTEWPTGDTVELARADFHGRWARWHPSPISIA